MTNKAELLQGVKAIASYLGISPTTARRRIDARQIPTFTGRNGTALYARRSDLDKTMVNFTPPPRGRPMENTHEQREEKRLARQERRRLDRLELAATRRRADEIERAANGLLYGVNAIADYLGLSDRQVYHLHESGRLPTFKMGRTVCASKSYLAEHFRKLSEGQ